MFLGSYIKLWESCSSTSILDCIYKSIRGIVWWSASFLPYLLIRLKPYERFQHLFICKYIVIYIYIILWVKIKIKFFLLFLFMFLSFCQIVLTLTITNSLRLPDFHFSRNFHFSSPFFFPQPHFLTLHIIQARSIVPHTLAMEFHNY